MHVHTETFNPIGSGIFEESPKNYDEIKN